MIVPPLWSHIQRLFWGRNGSELVLSSSEDSYQAGLSLSFSV